MNQMICGSIFTCTQPGTRHASRHPLCRQPLIWKPRLQITWCGRRNVRNQAIDPPPVPRTIRATFLRRLFLLVITPCGHHTLYRLEDWCPHWMGAKEQAVVISFVSVTTLVIGKPAKTYTMHCRQVTLRTYRLCCRILLGTHGILVVLIDAVEPVDISQPVRTSSSTTN